MANEGDLLVRIDRIRSFVAEAEKDPITGNTMMRLESPPLFTSQLDKGKRTVYDFDLNAAFESGVMERKGKEKLMTSAIKANRSEGSFMQLRSSKRKKYGVLSTSSNPAIDKGVELVERRSSSLNLNRNSTKYGSGSSISKPFGVSDIP